MDQPALFHERIEDALSEVINACGGRKKFACQMWPNKPARDAHNLIDACLNPERREKFGPDDLLYILKRGRDVGCHSGMRFLNAECGYLAPVAANPEDEKAALQRQMIEASKVLANSLDRLERLTQSPLQAVK
jgi:hypothetical protein